MKEDEALRRKKPRPILVVISFDGVCEKDFETLKAMPNIARMIREGVYSREVETITPSITYPVHTSILTGCYPTKHKIFHNHPFQPEITNDKNKKWYWYHDQIAVDTLFDAAKKARKKVGSIFWPVSGNAPVSYNLPEIIALPGENQTFKILKAGSVAFLLENEWLYRRLRKGIEEPYLADFATKVTTRMIEKKHPDLVLLHLVAVDTFRHAHGVDSSEALLGLKRYDDSLGEIFEALKRSGRFDEATIVVVTDHGLIDVEQYASVNAHLAEEGLQTWEKGRLSSFSVFAQSYGFGAYLRVNEGCSLKDENIRIPLQKAINKMIESNLIHRILSKEELIQEGCDGDFEMAIDACRGVHLSDSIYHAWGKKTLWIPTITEEERRLIAHDWYAADHGYDPHLTGYKNIFFASGPSIKKNVDIGPMRMVDIAPTLSDWMNIDFGPCDGKSLYQKTKE